MMMPAWAVADQDEEPDEFLEAMGGKGSCTHAKKEEEAPADEGAACAEDGYGVIPLEEEEEEEPPEADEMKQEDEVKQEDEEKNEEIIRTFNVQVGLEQPRPRDDSRSSRSPRDPRVPWRKHRVLPPAPRAFMAPIGSVAMAGPQPPRFPPPQPPPADEMQQVEEGQTSVAKDEWDWRDDWSVRWQGSGGKPAGFVDGVYVYGNKGGSGARTAADGSVRNRPSGGQNAYYFRTLAALKKRGDAAALQAFHAEHPHPKDLTRKGQGAAAKAGGSSSSSGSKGSKGNNKGNDKGKGKDKDTQRERKGKPY
jgi:hypothetical protein